MCEPDQPLQGAASELFFLIRRSAFTSSYEDSWVGLSGYYSNLDDGLRSLRGTVQANKSDVSS